ncbi:MAG: glycoside hydrolase family 88 protein [Bacteroidota bacterium]
MKQRIIIFCFLVFCKIANAQLDYAKGLAATVMSRYPDSMVVMKFLNHLMQDNQIRPGETAEEAQKNRPAVWNYEMGVVLMGFERLWKTTGDKKYLRYTKKIIDKFINEDGTIRTYALDEYNFDNIPAGRQLLRLYEVYKEEKYKKAYSQLRKQLSWQPRNKTGGFWHKLKYPSQMWLDGLYMAEPFYAECAVVNYTTTDFTDIINQFVWMEKFSRDPATGLLYHGWDESRLQKWANPKTGRSPEFWNRAMGWYLMGLVDVLDYIPVNYPRRTELIQILNRLAPAIIKYQDVASGVWWQITNKAAQPGNYLESSGTAMFVYALAKSIRLGYLTNNFLPATMKAYHGMIKEFVEKDAAGAIHYTKAVSGAGLGGIPYRDGSYEYYVSEPKRDDDLKAIGPFMQACIEISLVKKVNKK